MDSERTRLATSTDAAAPDSVPLEAVRLSVGCSKGSSSSGTFCSIKGAVEIGGCRLRTSLRKS